MRRSVHLGLFAVLLASASAAHAVAISGSSGLEGLGSFAGDLTFAASDDTSGTLTIQLTNTSDATNGGFLTGFVLNNPSDLITSVSLASTDPDFLLLGLANDGVSGSPFGDFDFGAALGGAFLGGGSPNGGLGVGASGTFTFTLTGSGFSGLTEADFLAELSTGGGEGAVAFLTRFRGFDDQGSDKVPVDPPNGVPEPGALGLLGLGVLALAARRRRA